MKKLLIVLFLGASLSCSKDDDNAMNNGNNNPPPGTSCGSYNGYTLYKDDGGCYYSDGYGAKKYVSSDLCSC